MGRLIKKGIAKDNAYIVLAFERESGFETYNVRFLIKEKENIFVGYGTHERTPDFHITIKDIKYACFYSDGKNIKIPYANGREFDGVCYREE